MPVFGDAQIRVAKVTLQASDCCRRLVMKGKSFEVAETNYHAQEVYFQESMRCVRVTLLEVFAGKVVSEL